MGMSLMETLWTWLGNQHKNPEHVNRTSIEGLDILQTAHAEGRGVLLIGAHLMALDAIAAGLARAVQVDVIYRYNKNPVIEWLMVRGRGRYFPNVIEREDARAILQSLKDGNILWYAADQDYGAKHSVFANFFGVPAATITGTARLAKFRGSPVVIMSQHRDVDTHRWTVRFEKGPDNYPSGVAVADAQSINDAIERAIRRTPEQYLWLHRRFKTRPQGAPKIY
jgi:KDO2-lipid IV(A) lauroyltransferase